MRVKVTEEDKIANNIFRGMFTSLECVMLPSFLEL